MSAVSCHVRPLRLQLSKRSVRAHAGCPQANHSDSGENSSNELFSASARVPSASEFAPLSRSTNQHVGQITAAERIRSFQDPSAPYADILWMRGNFQAQILVGDTESTESVVRRFKKACMQANVVNECRRRKFHETSQDVKKRKLKESSRARKLAVKMSGPRVYTPRPPPRGPVVDEQDANDNWTHVSK